MNTAHTIKQTNIIPLKTTMECENNKPVRGQHFTKQDDSVRFEYPQTIVESGNHLIELGI